MRAKFINSINESYESIEELRLFTEMVIKKFGKAILKKAVDDITPASILNAVIINNVDHSKFNVIKDFLKNHKIGVIGENDYDKETGGNHISKKSILKGLQNKNGENYLLFKACENLDSLIILNTQSHKLHEYVIMHEIVHAYDSYISNQKYTDNSSMKRTVQLLDKSAKLQIGRERKELTHRITTIRDHSSAEVNAHISSFYKKIIEYFLEYGKIISNDELFYKMRGNYLYNETPDGFSTEQVWLNKLNPHYKKKVLSKLYVFVEKMKEKIQKIHNACMSGDIKKVKDTVNLIYEGNTYFAEDTLFLCIKKNYLDITKYLLSERKIPFNKTSIDKALSYSNNESIHILLKKYRESAPSYDYETFDIRDTNYLDIPKKDTVEFKPGRDSHNINYFALKGDLESLKNMNMTSFHDVWIQQAVTFAAQEGHLDVVKYLMSKITMPPRINAIKKAKYFKHHEVYQYLYNLYQKYNNSSEFILSKCEAENLNYPLLKCTKKCIQNVITRQQLKILFLDPKLKFSDKDIGSAIYEASLDKGLLRFLIKDVGIDIKKYPYLPLYALDSQYSENRFKLLMKMGASTEKMDEALEKAVLPKVDRYSRYLSKPKISIEIIKLIINKGGRMSKSKYEEHIKQIKKEMRQFGISKNPEIDPKIKELLFRNESNTGED